MYGVPPPEETKLLRVQYNVKGYMQPVLEQVVVTPVTVVCRSSIDAFVLGKPYFFKNKGF